MFSNPYSPYLFITAIIACFTAMVTWRRRSAPGAAPLFLMLLTVAIWAGANGLVFETNNPVWKTFWFNVLTFGAVMSTPAFWAFGVEFTDHPKWLTAKNLSLVSIVPITSVILAWTTSSHGLFYATVNLTQKLPNGDWNFAPGPFYWVHIIYSYSLTVFIISLIVRKFIQSPPALRGQSATILVGTFVPLLGNILYSLMMGAGKSTTIDPTPLLFAIMGCIFVYGLLRYSLFDIIPVAWHTLVEYMQDGMVVIDDKNRIVDVNSSALRLLKWQQPPPIGRNVQELLTGWFEQLPNFPIDIYVETEIHIPEHLDRYFELRIEPIINKSKLTGRLIILRDITRQKSAEKALQDSHDRLRIHLIEIEMLQDALREQAIRDPLTGLFNRRYMQETLERELARASREGSTIGICMADIDNFKSFNDQHGHNAGDLILKNLTDIFTTYSRAEDVVCRYGGEEFLILLPGADLDVTCRRAEDWCRAFEQSKVEFEGEFLSTTLSIGVAVFPQHGHTGDDLLRLADEAMYISKRNGRNRINSAKSNPV